jgi:hypothetical protein
MKSGKLALNGFTITGGVVGVNCDGPCKVIGPGTVVEGTQIGINGFESLRIRDVTLTDHVSFAVQCFRACKIDGATTISNNGAGIRVGAKLTLDGATVTGNMGSGIDASNTDGSARVDVRNSTVTNNRDGIRAQRLAKITDSTVSGNTRHGVLVGIESGPACARKGTARLMGATVTGNATEPTCGVSVGCGDLSTCSPPKLAGGSTCDRSFVLGSDNVTADWDVCAAD